MLTQIFCKPIATEILFKLLSEICTKTDKYYFIDMNVYRKLTFHNLYQPFCDAILEYYHVSKRFYVTRKLTYNSFTNLVRQLCKTNNIMYTSEIKYNESKYNINYFIYF